MSTDSAKPNVLTRSFRWLFSWRTARRALLALAVLVTLWGIFVVEENWRCKRDWENYKRGLQAKGAWHEWDELIPPPVPDAENLYAAPHIADAFIKNRKDNYVETLRSNYTAALEQHEQKHAGTFPLAELVVVRPGEPAPPKVDLEISLADDTAREQVRALLEAVVGPHCNASQNIMLFARPPETIKPVRLVVRAANTPDSKALARLFAKAELWDLDFVFVQPTAKPDTFRVEMDTTTVVTKTKKPSRRESCLAAEYLQASRELEPFYEQLDAALRRLQVRMGGDYDIPWDINIPNFVMLRFLAQEFCARAQCQLLLGQPNEAVRELARVKQLQRFTVESNPMTLVSAMINVAIHGLYSETIAEGFRLGAWQDANLSDLQMQIGDTDLIPPVVRAFEMERIAINKSCDRWRANPDEFLRSWDMLSAIKKGSHTLSFEQRKELLVLQLIPTGWYYQNQLNYNQVWDCLPLKNYNASTRTLSTTSDGEFEKVINAVVQDKGVFKGLFNRIPKTLLTQLAMPNYKRAMQTATRNQTRVNLVLIACALERHRLAHGEYPATLDALAPQFIEKLPHDLIGGAPLKYQRTPDGKFLLYSIGWNETDDGGKISHDKDGKPNPYANDGDWVWSAK